MSLDNLQNYMIGVVLFIVVISGGAFMLGEFYSVQPSLDDAGEIDQFAQSLNKSAEITTAVGGIEDSIQAVGEGDAGPLGWIDALIGSAFKGVKALLGTLGFVNVAAGESAGILGIPDFLVGLLVLLVVILIGFAIWAAFLRQ